VNNGLLRGLVKKMREDGLSPKSISNYIGLVKLVVASAVDDNGEELFPRKWNSDFIDLPLIRKQRQPSVTPEIMSAIVSKASGQYRVLYAFLAITGLRIGEALALEIDKHFSTGLSIVDVRQSVWNGVVQTPKTDNAVREVDMDPIGVELIRNLIGSRTKGFLFANRARKPLHQSNVLRRSLHPILADLGIPKLGFHAFRRFRATYLRKNRLPEDLIRFYMGHANQSITDEYAKVSEDVVFRKHAIEHLGVGFEISD
jgi:integrase